MKRPGLLPLDQALASLLSSARVASGQETVSLEEALGRVLAVDQAAALFVPPADNSAMDGYAVRASDAGQTLEVSQRVAAGDDPHELAPATAARIFTGATIPPGADTVVMQEAAQREGDRVALPPSLKVGEHIRRQGQDCAPGDPLLRAGRLLRPQDLGLIASQGVGRLPVHARLRVALLSTGSELRDVDSGALPPGAIFNSNRPMLAGLLRNLGCEIVDLGIIEDDPQATAAALARAAREADLIISSGGVSVGEADYVRDAVMAQGEINLWRIAIKPGKPFAHGRVGATPFMGLPGNPSSAFVTFVLLARPYICALQGRADSTPLTLRARADFAVSKAGSRREFLRATTFSQDGELWVRPFANQSSGILSSVSHSDALAVVPVGSTVSRGDQVEVLLMDSLLS